MAIRIKYRWKRFRVRWRKFREKIDNRISPSKDKITPYQEKVLKLWRICLKDTDTQMAYNSWGIRQLEKNNLFMIFKSSGTDYVMTVMDIDQNRKSVYEIHIPTQDADDACKFFDTELEKRMREAENNKRRVIDDDLSKLLEQEVRSLDIKRKKPKYLK